MRAAPTPRKSWNFLPKQSDSFMYRLLTVLLLVLGTHTHRGTIKHIYTEDASNAHTHLEITLFFWPCERASARQVGSGAFEVARPPPLALPAAADIGSSGCSD